MSKKIKLAMKSSSYDFGLSKTDSREETLKIHLLNMEKVAKAKQLKDQMIYEFMRETIAEMNEIMRGSYDLKIENPLDLLEILVDLLSFINTRCSCGRFKTMSQWKSLQRDLGLIGLKIFTYLFGRSLEDNQRELGLLPVVHYKTLKKWRDSFYTIGKQIKKHRKSGVNISKKPAFADGLFFDGEMSCILKDLQIYLSELEEEKFEDVEKDLLKFFGPLFEGRVSIAEMLLFAIKFKEKYLPGFLKIIRGSALTTIDTAYAARDFILQNAAQFSDDRIGEAIEENAAVLKRLLYQAKDKPEESYKLIDIFREIMVVEDMPLPIVLDVLGVKNGKGFNVLKNKKEIKKQKVMGLLSYCEYLKDNHPHQISKGVQSLYYVVFRRIAQDLYRWRFSQSIPDYTRPNTLDYYLKKIEREYLNGRKFHRVFSQVVKDLRAKEKKRDQDDSKKSGKGSKFPSCLDKLGLFALRDPENIDYPVFDNPDDLKGSYEWRRDDRDKRAPDDYGSSIAVLSRDSIPGF